MAKQEAIAKKEKMAADDETKTAKLVKKMLKASGGASTVIPVCPF